MNYKTILNYVGYGLTFGGILFFAGKYVKVETAKQQESMVTTLENSVKQKLSADDYNQMKSEIAKLNIKKRIITWQKALDSINAHSAYEKVYKEGIEHGKQIIRDSIRSAQKAIK